MKKILFLVLIIVLIAAIIIGTNILKRNQGDQKNLVNISLDVSLRSISITKAENKLLKKEITSSEDIKELIDLLKSITLKEKLSDCYKGWCYAIDIEDTNNQSYCIEFLGDKLGIDNTFYTVDPSVCDNVEKLYNKFNYPETNPLN